MKRKNIKITVTFDRSTTELLTCVAHRSKKSIIHLVEQLTLEALEAREEVCLAKLAEKLDDQNTKSYTHDQTWLAKR